MRGKKLLGPGAVAAVSDIEGGLAETGNAWPSDSDSMDARGVRGVGIDIGEKREGKKLLRT